MAHELTFEQRVRIALGPHDDKDLDAVSLVEDLATRHTCNREVELEAEVKALEAERDNTARFLARCGPPLPSRPVPAHSRLDMPSYLLRRLRRRQAEQEELRATVDENGGDDRIEFLEEMLDNLNEGGE